MSNDSGLEIFETFPEIGRLGQSEIQRQCDAWIVTPLAREFAVSALKVNDRLLLDFQCQLTHKVNDGEAYYFPIDRLLLFIADNGVSDPVERQSLKHRIAAAREQGGPDVFSRFKLRTGPKMSLFVTCTNCGNVMQTQFKAARNEQIRFDPEEIECPRCFKSFEVDGSELHFEPE